MKCLRHGPGDVTGLGDQEVVLGDRQRDPGDVRFLEAVRADQAGRHLPGDGDHRHRVHVGVGERRDQVGRARPRGGDAHPRPAGHLRVAGRRVAGTLLMPDQDVAHAAGVEQRVVGGEDGPAGDAEDDIDAELFQRCHQRLGARHRYRRGGGFARRAGAGPATVPLGCPAPVPRGRAARVPGRGGAGPSSRPGSRPWLWSGQSSPMFPSSALVTRTLATKNPSCLGQSG